MSETQSTPAEQLAIISRQRGATYLLRKLIDAGIVTALGTRTILSETLEELKDLDV
jgi:hypothetical protein